jgi:hypothetical protein
MPLPPGAAIVPLTATSLSATIWIRPSLTMTLVAEARPFAFTTSLKLGAVPTNRAPLYRLPATLIVPADRAMPSIAFTCPWIEIRPVPLRGAVPASSCVTAASLGLPGDRKNPSTNPCVGVDMFRLPTLTMPPALTMKPCGLAK